MLPITSKHIDSSVKQEGIGVVSPIHRGCEAGREQKKVVSDACIARYFKKYKSNKVLSQAFEMIEGAHLSHAQDIKVLLNCIRGLNEDNLELKEILALIDHDEKLLSVIGKIAKGRLYSAVFRDQIRTMIDFKTLAKAKCFIREFPMLIRAGVPQNLLNTSGSQLLILKASLFYIAMAKYKKAGKKFSLIMNRLSSFYPGEQPCDTKIQSLLLQTNLIYNQRFYTPALSYVKNANISLAVSTDREGLNVARFLGRQLSHPQMFFSDCSGFVANIAKKLHPKNTWLQNHRFMSWHLSDAYDRMMNQQYNTLYKFYGVSGLVRDLTEHERGAGGHSRVIQELCSIFVPVSSPRSNVQPGDVIVVRYKEAKIEGHVVIVVEQNASDLDEMTVVELTRADVGGTRHGYNWRKFSLSSPGYGKECRVLRFRENFCKEGH